MVVMLQYAIVTLILIVSSNLSTSYLQRPPSIRVKNACNKVFGIKNPLRNVDFQDNAFIQILTRNPISLLIRGTYSFFWNFPRKNLPYDTPWVFLTNTTAQWFAYNQFPHNLPPYRYLGEGYPADFFCYGLLGNTLPLGNWDPFDLAQVGKGVVRKYRESELKHGRLAMLATLGFLVQESFHPIYPSINGLATTHMQQLRELQPEQSWLGGNILSSTLHWSPDYIAMLMVLMSVEIFALRRNWTRWKPHEYKHQFAHNIGIGNLKDTYENGNYGFDPLRLMPDTEDDKKWIQEVELNHGRLAMMAFMGMLGQEYVTGVPVTRFFELSNIFD